MKKYVQFSNAEQTAIKAVFGSPQSEDSFENLGEIDAEDPRYLDYTGSLPKELRELL